MKLAWFTPFAAGSIVGRFSGNVTRELARHADVDIWHPPAPALRPTALRTIAMPRRLRVSPSMLEAYDLAVYNLGEEDDRRIVEAACVAPGIGILHGPAPEVAVRKAYAVVVHSESTRAFATRLSLNPLAIIPIAQENFPAGQHRLGLLVDGRFARTPFTPREYATALVALADALLLAEPVLKCVDLMAGRLAEISSVEAYSREVVDRVAGEAYALFRDIPSAIPQP